MSKDFQAVRQEILAMHQRIKEENHYELLGVPKEADAALISSRFRELAKKWHVDRFSQHDLGAEKAKVQEIFAALNTAHKTLTDNEKRAEYDFEIDEGPDIGTILEAESQFRRAKNMLQQGSYKGAHEGFKQAYELKSDEREYQAYYLYTEYLLIAKDDEGRVTSKKRTKEIFDELDAINTELSEKDWLLTFLGVVSLGLGQDRQAESLFSEALMANSQNHEAKRQLRLIRSRRKKGQSQGFFAKLFGGKK